MNYILLMGAPCQPFSQCWCSTHPAHPKCNTGVPINDYLGFLAIAGALIYLKMKKLKQ